MEQINYQEEYKKLFSAYLANQTPGEAESQSIKILLDRFPFCQPLHFIYAASLRNDPEKFKTQLTIAAMLSPQRETLHQTIYNPDKFNFKERTGSGLQNGYVKEDIGPGISSENFEGAPELDTSHGMDASPVTERISEIETPENEFQGETVNAEVDVTGEEKLVPDNIAAADYFTFDRSAADPLQQTERADLNQENSEGLSDQNLKNPEKTDTQEIANYNDDKLPYTFLWWLDKTRREHKETYQPYVNFKLDTSRPIRKNAFDELNQQIIENIFHLQSALEEKEKRAPSHTVEFELKRKGEDIIEKFIKDVPQIRPMQPEKISTENKARKSAEDLYDLVSETLARIYSDQMLFHKAIDTYKKLSLKFPEKSAYFADQIGELEKKIN